MVPLRWKCPACSTPIRQQLAVAGGKTPRPDMVYRCAVCREELILDPQTDQLMPAALQAETVDDRPLRSRRTR
jgi:hypothetical protein